jgi:hypothetical protein
MRHSPALTVRTGFTTMQQNAPCGPIGKRHQCWLRGISPGRAGGRQACWLAKMSPRPGRTRTSAAATVAEGISRPHSHAQSDADNGRSHARAPRHAWRPQAAYAEGRDTNPGARAPGPPRPRHRPGTKPTSRASNPPPRHAWRPQAAYAEGRDTNPGARAPRPPRPRHRPGTKPTNRASNPPPRHAWRPQAACSWGAGVPERTRRAQAIARSRGGPAVPDSRSGPALRHRGFARHAAKAAGQQRTREPERRGPSR